ncbi:hypothetical protein PLESTB_001244900 [Pleodorina starrii]|uniref:Uncharacterized protein n=1 Tax=Pleodorina starrii TaxID=330485 RepID=A0A9W6BSV7_9CHLO|nr:hypothetical protein PLESTM_000214900 [Pleodorina starrii]GLC57602.1 hypothetical protein PLESTB_001244900 [Pleodorina starrii]GLC63272.1 hypothetical protein PLESTF_000018700 [Pleodorina starrii]
MEMDPSAPAAAIAAALNSPEQFGQILQQQQLQQQQALAAGQDGRTGAAAPTAAAAAAGQPAGIDLASLQEMFAGFTQQAFTELQSHVDARLAQLTAQLTTRNSRRQRAPAAAAAAETFAAAAADALEVDGAGADEPSSGSSSDDEARSSGTFFLISWVCQSPAVLPLAPPLLPPASPLLRLAAASPSLRARLSMSAFGVSRAAWMSDMDKRARELGDAAVNRSNGDAGGSNGGASGSTAGDWQTQEMRKKVPAP